MAGNWPSSFLRLKDNFSLRDRHGKSRAGKIPYYGNITKHFSNENLSTRYKINTTFQKVMFTPVYMHLIKANFRVEYVHMYIMNASFDALCGIISMQPALFTKQGNSVLHRNSSFSR